MEILKIKQENGIFSVTIKPNFFARLFGAKTRTERYKDAGRVFNFGNGSMYTREDGTQTHNGDTVGGAIDKWRRF